MQPLIDEHTAAGLLGVSRETLRRWRYAGKGPAFSQLGPQVIRYDIEAIRAFEAATSTPMSIVGHGEFMG